MKHWDIDKKFYLFFAVWGLIILISGCASVPQTPFEKCNELARRAGVYKYTYAIEEKDGSISCVVPLDYSNPMREHGGRINR